VKSLGGDGERAAGNVVVAPLDGHRVLSSLLHHVTYLVVVVSLVLDGDLFTRSFGSVHTDVQNVASGLRRIDGEIVGAPGMRLLETETSACHFGGVAVEVGHHGVRLFLLARHLLHGLHHNLAALLHSLRRFGLGVAGAVHLPWASGNVYVVIFDVDVVVAIDQRGEANLVAIVSLGTVHGNLGRSVYSYSESTSAGGTGIDQKVGFHTNF